MHCDYSLLGLAEPRCPECGSAFVPGNRRTYRRNAPLTPLARQCLRRPGWPLHGLAILGALAIMEPFSLPGDRLEYLGYEWLLIIAPIAFVTWLVRALLRLIVGFFACMPLSRGGKPAVSWFVTPALLLPAIGLAFTTVPMYLRAFISRPFMDRFAKRCLALPPNAPLPEPDWIGLYPVCSVDRAYGGISFRLRTDGFCCRPEAIYAPGRTLAESEAGHQVTPVTGDWYFTGWDWR